MTSRDLSEKIKQESAKLKGLLEKRTEIDIKIKKSESNLEKYQLMQNNEKYEAIQKATEGSGVSIADILAALQSGDMLALQERIEAAKVQAENDTTADAGSGAGEDESAEATENDTAV